MFYDINFQGMGPMGSLKTPYIRDGNTVVYECNGKEGSIAFNGYFYIEDGPPENPKPWQSSEDWLPKKVCMTITRREDDADGKVLQSCVYLVEIYKKEMYESTNEKSYIEEEGIQVEVCFFPTNRMKIWFRVLEILEEKGPDEFEV